MKITKRQLRRIIKEITGSIDEMPDVAADKERRMYKGITDVLFDKPGMGGVELVDTVNQMHPDLAADDIWSFLDQLVEDGELNFNLEEDEWTLA